jgi:hypothetical protein
MPARPAGSRGFREHLIDLFMEIGFGFGAFFLGCIEAT